MADLENVSALAILIEDKEKCTTNLLETLVQMADQVESKGHFETAIPYYHRCLELVKPKDPNFEKQDSCRILFRLGKAMKEIGQIEKAVRVCKF